MKTTRLASKGQTLLPKPVRDPHYWTTGTDFVVEDTGDGVLPRPIKTAQPTDVVGSLPVKAPARTIEAIGSAIDAEPRDRRGRGQYS